MTERREALSLVLDSLPDDPETTDIAVRIRAALRPLVVQAIGAPECATVPVDRGTCPNCGGQVVSAKSPYCSEPCKEQAAFVRRFRHATEDGSLSTPVRQEGLGQALWALQGGGYPRRQAMVPARLVAQVIAKHEGKCAGCGAPATGVDHTGSG